MKRAGLILSGVLAVAFLTAFTIQSIWNMDYDNSEVGFSITNSGISDVTGTFNDFTATLKSNKEDFSDAVVEATIQVGSIYTRITPRDEHLRTADFFDAAKYPQIKFKSTGIKSAGNGKYKLRGNLTIKDVTKEVELDLHYRGTKEDQQSKKSIAGFKLTGTINRLDFGVGQGFPSAVLSNEVEITVNGRFLK